jgi:hypothetical protein
MVECRSSNTGWFPALTDRLCCQSLEEVSGFLFDAWRDVNGGDELREILDRTGWGYRGVSSRLRTL